MTLEFGLERWIGFHQTEGACFLYFSLHSVGIPFKKGDNDGGMRLLSQGWMVWSRMWHCKWDWNHLRKSSFLSKFYFISNGKPLRFLKQKSDLDLQFRKITLAVVWRMALWEEINKKNILTMSPWGCELGQQ